MSGFNSIPSSTVVIILNFLRPLDLLSLSYVNQAIFSNQVISASIEFQLATVYSRFYKSKARHTPVEGDQADNKSSEILWRPNFLLFVERKTILSALQLSQVSVGDSGYFISASWYAHAKKYYEALCTVELTPSTTSVSSNTLYGEGKVATSIISVTPTKQPPNRKVKRTPTPTQRPTSGMSPSLSLSSPAPTLPSSGASLRPVDSMTADISCPHGCLAILNKNSNIRRRQVEARVFTFLKKFFPAGPEFAASGAECSRCSSSDSQPKTVISIPSCPVPEGLMSLLNRKSGVPPLCAVTSGSNSGSSSNNSNSSNSSSSSAGRAIFADEQAIGCSGGSRANSSDTFYYDDNEADDMELALAMTISLEQMADLDKGESSGVELGREEARLSSPSSYTSSTQQPLVPGIYHIVPKEWMRRWRQVARAFQSKRLPDEVNLSTSLACVDYTQLLCVAHGLLLVPAHLEQFLQGTRRSLMGQLTEYSGEVVEVISSDEWNLLISHAEELDRCLRQVRHGTGMSSLGYGSKPPRNTKGRGTDLELSFGLDGEAVSWNISTCRKCEPLSYAQQLYTASGQRRFPGHGPNSNLNRKKR
jgi:hypothetical protein